MRATDDHCHLHIYKVTDDASILWDDAKDVHEPLWQIQLQLDTPDSLIVNLYDKFSKFLSESDEFPDTLEGLSLIHI